MPPGLWAPTVFSFGSHDNLRVGAVIPFFPVFPVVPGILHHSTSEEREEAPWGLPGGPQATAHPDPIPTDTQDPFLCTARSLAQCPQSTASEHRDSWGRMGSTQRIQPGRQAELPALSQKPVSGEGVSQRVGRGGDLSLAPPSVQTLHLPGGGGGWATEGIPFLSGPLLSFPISLIHSVSHLFMSSAFKDWCWGSMGKQTALRGFTVKGKRWTSKGR